MEIIRPVIKLCEQILNKQKIKPDKKYRFLEYIIDADMEEQKLLYNLLTGELILADRDEMYKNKEFLIEHWFLVPEDEDEQKLYKQFKSLLSVLRVSYESNYTILTTLYCNARCSYCYEKGINQVSMSKETAMDTVNFIEKTKQKGKVHLSWFGGEPLVNLHVIDIICSELNKKNIEFDSSMTSNGYCFCDDIIFNAKEKWNLKSVQISLDGTEEKYIAIKNYTSKNENAFIKVTDNIERLLRTNIRVEIRLNLSLENYEDLCQLCNWIKNRYKNMSGFFVYVAMLYDNPDNPYTKEQQLMLFEYYKKLQELIRQLNIGGRLLLRNGFKVKHCGADNEYCYTISPQGNLTGCQHFSDSEVYGDVKCGITDKTLYKEWFEQAKDYDECKSCKLYTECIRLSKCPIEASTCTQQYRDVIEYKLQLAMIDEYKRYREER